jgi:hypothetical protein
MSIKGELEGRTWGILAVGLMCLLAPSLGLQAGGRTPGGKVRVVTRYGLERFTGAVVGVRANAIVLETEQGEGRTVAIADISSVRIYRTSAILPGIFLGALAGGAVGLAVGSQEGQGQFLGGITVAAYSIGGVLLGAASGGLVGGLASADKTYDLTKMSAPEIETLMAKLRKMARVKNYQ